MKKLEKIFPFCERIAVDQLDSIKGGRSFSTCEYSTCIDDYQDTKTDFYNDDGVFERSETATFQECCD